MLYFFSFIYVELFSFSAFFAFFMETTGRSEPQ